MIHNMTQILIGIGLGLFLLISGIFALNVNFYLGLVVIGLGAVISASFNIKFILAMINWSVAKGEEGRKKKELRKPPAKQTQQTAPSNAALMNAIKEKRKTDPLIGAKLGSKEVNQRLLDAMKNETGVHVESLLCALGALAGYSCQANLRAQALEKGVPETAVFTVVDTADGKKYFFGDPLNKVLAESQYSVWSLAAGAAQQNGCSSLPDIAEIFGHVSKTVGGVEFGIPRIPDGHRPGDTPINYVKALWPKLLPTMKQFCQKPSEWPILFGLAVQETLDMSKGVIAPDLALKIIMESAIPMSKVDLASA